LGFCLPCLYCNPLSGPRHDGPPRNYEVPCTQPLTDVRRPHLVRDLAPLYLIGTSTTSSRLLPTSHRIHGGRRSFAMFSPVRANGVVCLLASAAQRVGVSTSDIFNKTMVLNNDLVFGRSSQPQCTTRSRGGASASLPGPGYGRPADLVASACRFDLQEGWSNRATDIKVVIDFDLLVQ